MRLIDGDELKKEFPHDEDWDFPVNTNGYVVETINRMPTVDAIPIDWIKKWAKDTEYAEDRVIIARWVTRWMVADWRKENE